VFANENRYVVRQSPADSVLGNCSDAQSSCRLDHRYSRPTSQNLYSGVALLPFFDQRCRQFTNTVVATSVSGSEPIIAFAQSEPSSVQLRRENNGLSGSQAHRMKHLNFDLLLVRDQGVGGSNPLSPTNCFNLQAWLLAFRRRDPGAIRCGRVLSADPVPFCKLQEAPLGLLRGNALFADVPQAWALSLLSGHSDGEE
jgi:hypothetical protein